MRISDWSSDVCSSDLSLSEGLNMKLFPVCYAAHRLINSATALRDSPACRVEAIREVRVSLGKTQSQILCYRAPTNSLEAKRSEEHTSELQSPMRTSYAVSCLKNNLLV